MNAVCEPEQLRPLVADRAALLATKSAVALARAKKALNAALAGRPSREPPARGRPVRLALLHGRRARGHGRVPREARTQVHREMSEESREALERAARLGGEFLSGLGARPVGVPVDAGGAAAAAGGAAPRCRRPGRPGAGRARRGRGPRPRRDRRARATSASSSAARSRRRSPPTGSPPPGTRTPASTPPRPRRRSPRRSPAAWLLDLLGLPAERGVGFVTGGQMANVSCLAAARHARPRARRLGRRGARACTGAPPLRDPRRRGGARHDLHRRCASSASAPRGRERVAADGQGRMRPDALADALAAGEGPALVCAQAGNVNTGAFDPLGEIAALTAGARRLAPRRRRLRPLGRGRARAAPPRRRASSRPTPGPPTRTSG